MLVEGFYIYTPRAFCQFIPPFIVSWRSLSDLLVCLREVVHAYRPDRHRSSAHISIFQDSSPHSSIHLPYHLLDWLPPSIGSIPRQRLHRPSGRELPDLIPFEGSAIGGGCQHGTTKVRNRVDAYVKLLTNILRIFADILFTGVIPFLGYHHALMLLIAIAIILLCKLILTLDSTCITDTWQRCY